MSLERKLIRFEVARILMGRTFAGDNVSTNRATRVHQGQLPALVVYTLEDLADAEPYEDAPRTYLRRAKVVVEGIVEETTEGGLNDDEADDLADQVEQLLLPRMLLDRITEGEDSALAIQVRETRYEGCTFLSIDGGRTALAGFACVWSFAYVQCVDELTGEGRRGRLEAFRTAGVTYEHAPPAALFDEIRLPGP